MKSVRVFLILIGAVFCLAAAQDKPVPIGYKVGAITLVRVPVLQAGNLPAGAKIITFANRLHIQTREWIIRNELLVREGDIYRDDLVEESERNLRKLYTLGEVYITRDTVSGGRINLQVHTRDKWSLELGGSYKQAGGITTTRLTLQEHNLVGLAQLFRVSYNRSSDRTRPEGREIVFYDRRLLGSRWAISWQYSSAEELDIQAFSVHRGYFSEATTWAGGTFANRLIYRPRYYEAGRLTQVFEISQNNAGLWGSRSFGDTLKLRLGSAITHTRTKTTNIPVRPIHNLDLVTVAISPRYATFYKDRYLDNFGRIEDVAEGFLLNLILGANLYRSAAATARRYYRCDLKLARRLTPSVFAGAQVSWSAFATDHALADQLTWLTIQGYFKLAPRHLLAARLQGGWGWNWSPYRQFVLGSLTGLRGYPAYAFNGEKLLLVNLEERFFSPLKLWIFRFGSTLFFDAGTVQQSGEPLRLNRLHPAWGFGIRIENTVQQGSGILRIDFVFTPEQAGLAEMVISTGQLFPAFLGLSFVAPNAIR
ncbi:MAG: hypothetical protein V3W14_08930 [Candidatus Neomarinimicrobiota bacterium]